MQGGKYVILHGTFGNGRPVGDWQPSPDAANGHDSRLYHAKHRSAHDPGGPVIFCWLQIRGTEQGFRFQTSNELVMISHLA